MGPAARALAADVLEGACDAGAFALHHAGEVGAEEVANAPRVARGRVDERDPARVGPALDGAVANALGGDRRLSRSHPVGACDRSLRPDRDQFAM
jgi:hypothetical protein